MQSSDNAPRSKDARSPGGGAGASMADLHPHPAALAANARPALPGCRSAAAFSIAPRTSRPTSSPPATREWGNERRRHPGAGRLGDLGFCAGGLRRHARVRAAPQDPREGRSGRCPDFPLSSRRRAASRSGSCSRPALRPATTAGFSSCRAPCSLPDRAKASDIAQLTAVLVDLDEGDIDAKVAHLTQHLGSPSFEVASGGLTPERRRSDTSTGACRSRPRVTRCSNSARFAG